MPAGVHTFTSRAEGGMIEILDVAPESIAAELGLQPGDRLVALNGETVHDLLDYQLLAAGEELLVEIERADGELWEIEVAKDADEPLGLQLPHPEPRQCGNNCLFCFVHQLPPGMRPSLYVKDEDYRFSFLYGAYVTLTNLDEGALQRILRQRLSPLYVSVHATDEQLRSRLLGRRTPPLLDLLRRLVDGGIVIHAQVVICPGINDGAELEHTFRDLLPLHPGLASLALVPVGLTGYRRHLPQLRPVAAAEARDLLDWVAARQAECLQRFATRLVYAADELYLAAGHELPPLTEYEELPQLENGVGLLARFHAEAAEVLAQAGPLAHPPVTVVTGVSAGEVVTEFCAALSAQTGAPINTLCVPNRFFAGAVTVTGLLTGSDILAACTERPPVGTLLLPEVLLREGSEVLLDDLTLTDLARQLEAEVEAFPADPWGLWDLLETLALETTRKE